MIPGGRDIHLRKSFICSSTIALVLFVPVWLASAQAPQMPAIAEIRVEGLVRISEQLVRAQIEVEAGQTLNPIAVARDIKRLYGLGYFTNIQVTYEPKGTDEVSLEYVLTEKQLIGRVEIVGNKKIKERQVRDVLTWKESDPYLAESNAEERQAILDLYSSRGYPKATVEVKAEELEDGGRVTLTYTITEGAKTRIKAIGFEGNEAMSDRKLRKAMRTRRALWFFGGRYDPAKFEADLANLVELYGDQGYLEARFAETDFDYSKKGKKLRLTLHAVEGPLYHVATLEAANNIVYDDDELLLPKVVEVQQGDVHNKTRVHEDAQALEKGYQDSGYINARVTPRVTLDLEKATTHIVHDVDEGDLKYVREVTITGNSITRDDVIRQRVMLEPGDRFDGSAVRMSERALNNTQFFENVRIFPDDSGLDDRFTNLFVDVEEGKTGSFQFGGGYSTEDRMSGFFEIRKRNFDILNWPTLQGGGQQLDLRISTGATRSQYSLSFSDPQLAGYPLSFGFDVFNERHNYTGGLSLTEESQGIQLYLGKSLSHFVTLRTSLRYEDNDVSNLPFLAAPALRRYQGGSTTISASWGLIRNTQDHHRDPTTGAKHNIMFELAGLGGDNQYGKIEHDSTWYWSFGKKKKWVLSYHTREGLVDEYGSSDFVPLTHRFFCGGSSTVRGFETRDIGPKVRRFFILGEKDAIGGELLLVNNLEIKHKLTDNLRVYGFLDAGTVWDQVSDFDLGDLKYSVGIGFGVDVPRMGPIRVDYGFPLNPDGDQGSGKMHLMTGFRF